MLLGNDLAGDKANVNPLITAKPCADQIVNPIEQDVPDPCIAWAVMCSISKKALEVDKDIDEINVDLSDTFVGYVLNETEKTCGPAMLAYLVS